MNKVTKVLLITAGSCIGLGVVLGTVGLVQARANGFEAFKSKREKVITDVNDSFSSIDISEVSDEVEIRPSDDGNVTVICWDSERLYHEVEVKDDTLIVKFEDEQVWFDSFNFDFDGSDEKDYGTTIIYLPEGEYEDLNINTTSGDVLIPDGYTFGDVDINTVSGGVSDSATSTGIVNVNTTSGCISDLNINGISADINTVSGDISLNTCDVSGSIEVTTTSGEINLKDISTAVAVISTVSGEVTLTNFESDITDIDTTSGDVTGTLIGSYNINTDTVSGDINITCDNLSDGNKFNVSTVSGDIELN